MPKLTDKQKLFVKEYLIDMNATQAAIRAGYSEKSARQIGSETLSYPYIQDAVQKAMEERAGRVDITADMVLQELRKLAFSNMENYMDLDGGRPTLNFNDLTSEQSAAITEVTIDTRHEYNDGEPVAEIEKVKFKLADKGINLERIGRHLKMFTDKTDLHATGGLTVTIGGRDAEGL